MDLSLDLSAPSSATYGDLVILNGDLVATSDVNPQGTHPVLQSIVQRLRMFQGEWFLDVTQGVPWFQQIFAKGARQSDIDAALQTCILNTPGVLNLTRYSMTLKPATRQAALSFACSTVRGTVDYTSTIEFSGGTQG